MLLSLLGKFTSKWSNMKHLVNQTGTRFNRSLHQFAVVLQISPEGKLIIANRYMNNLIDMIMKFHVYFIYSIVPLVYVSFAVRRLMKMSPKARPLVPVRHFYWIMTAQMKQSQHSRQRKKIRQQKTKEQIQKATRPRKEKLYSAVAMT